MCQEVGYYHLYIIVTNEVGHFSYNNRGYSFGQSSPNAWKPLITPKITHAVLWFEFFVTGSIDPYCKPVSLADS